jgi:hypothetical protein
MADPTGTGAHPDPGVDEDDVPAHRGDGKVVRFSVGANGNKRFGDGLFESYVELHELGGDGSWWLDPVEAVRLGETLVDLGARAHWKNVDRELERERRQPRPEPARPDLPGGRR